MSELNLKMDKDFKKGLDDIKSELIELRKSVDVQTVSDNTEARLKEINKELKSLNKKEIPQTYAEVKVKNLKDIKVNQNVEAQVKLPKWLDKSPAKPIVESFTRGFEYLYKAISNIKITNRLASDYIPVRRVYRDGNGQFRFDDTGAVIGGGGGGGGGGGQDNPRACITGHTVVAAPATAVVLKSDTPIQSVTIKSLYTNTGYIYVGNSGTASSTTGFVLGADEQISMDIRNTNLVWIDCSVAGEGVSWIAVI